MNLKLIHRYQKLKNLSQNNFVWQPGRGKAAVGIIGFFSSRLFKILISAGFVLYILFRFDLGAVASGIVSANPSFLIYAAVIFIVSGLLGAAQWGVILRFHGVRLKFTGTIARYFMGLFFNFILPGFVGGDVIRVYKTSIASGMTTQAFSSTLADRVMGLLVLVLFSFGAFFVIPRGPAQKALPVAVIMFLILAGFIWLFAFKPAGRFFNSIFGKIIPSAITEKLRAVYLEMHELTRSPLTLLALFAFSFFIQFTRIAVHYVCGMAVGIEFGFSYYALFVPLMAIMASLPISIGGFGVREAFAVVLFSSVGVENELVLSYSLLASVCSFAGALPGAAAFALSGNDTRMHED